MPCTRGRATNNKKTECKLIINDNSFGCMSSFRRSSRLLSKDLTVRSRNKDIMGKTGQIINNTFSGANATASSLPCPNRDPEQNLSTDEDGPVGHYITRRRGPRHIDSGMSDASCDESMLSRHVKNVTDSAQFNKRRCNIPKAPVKAVSGTPKRTTNTPQVNLCVTSLPKRQKTEQNIKMRLQRHQTSIKVPGLPIPDRKGKTCSSGRCQQLQPTTKKEIFQGWQRAINKYSPSKEATTSPIKHTLANMESVILDDLYLDMYIWTVNMSEQHCYDNAFLLISYCKNDFVKMASILHRDSVGVDMDFFNGLVEVTRLGQGAFGSVYSCYDPKTKLKYAVKHIFGDYKLYSDHTSNLVSYMAERNANIRAMNSAFIARFYYSLQMNSTGDSFLFLEFCIGDLQKYLHKIKFMDLKKISAWFNYNQEDVTQNIYEVKNELLELSYLYIFELLCALDFLVSCNIVHQDIKPDNIMISDNLHLKIGDFGLAYRTRTIHRKTNEILIKSSQIERNDRKDYHIQIDGTIDYQDFEAHLLLLEIDSGAYLKKILKNKDVYNAPGISFENHVLEPTFLVDTWAAGVVAVSLLFRGFLLFHPRHAHSELYKDIPRSSKSKFLLNLIGRKDVYDHYIYGGLISAGGKENEELMKFIASIFLPRLSRCASFTKEKSVYHYSKLVKMRYVDIDKVAKLKTFADRHFNKSDIHLRSVPEVVRKVFSRKVMGADKKFSELLQEIEMDRNKAKRPLKILTLNPGVTINFFN